MTQRWQITARVEAAGAWPVVEALEDYAISVAVFEVEPEVLWEARAITDHVPDRAELTARVALAATSAGVGLPDIIVTPLIERDWLAENRASFPPLDLGRVHVRGSHVTVRPPVGRIDLVIDAGIAFGSGTHATTSGCVLTLQDIAKRRRPARVLDMGCGSGILALVAARLWPTAQVSGVDIDPASARTATANARDNGVGARMRAVAGDGYRTSLVRERAPFDLILANILARPLARMAPDLARALAPGGLAVLSGLLVHQETAVLAAHRAQGLHLVSRRRIDGWSTLVVG